MNFSLKLFSILALAVTAGCSSSGTIKAPPNHGDWDDETVPSNDLEAQKYSNIQKMYAERNFDSALKRAIEFEKLYPKSNVYSRVKNIHGLIYLLKNKPDMAVVQFREAAQTSMGEEFRNYILYNLACAQIEAKQSSITTLDQIDPSKLEPQTQQRYFYIRALSLDRIGKKDEALSSMLKSGTVAGATPSPREHFEEEIQKLLESKKSVQALEQLLTEYEGSIFAEFVVYRMASLSADQKNYGQAERYYRLLVNLYPNSRFSSEALSYLKSTHTQRSADENAVGVLLPMTGRFAPYAARALRGIELAFKIYADGGKDSGIKLYIEDAGETPETAMVALDRLAEEHRVVAVLGPLTGKGIDLVSNRANELGVPLISLSQQIPNEVNYKGSYVFHSGVSLKQQIQALVEYAVKKKDLKRLGILYPRTQFGKESRDLFWNAANELGAEIVEVESYNGNETDFRVPVEKMTGLFYTDAREAENEKLKAARALNKITKRTRKTEKFYRLDPIVDFDAIFIPDDAKTVGQILPTFAFNDVDKTTFLGLATWNSPELIKRADSYAEQALFLDTFFLGSPSSATQTFVKTFQDTFDMPPTTLEASAYDAGLILEQALITSQRPLSPTNIRDRLEKISNLIGSSGPIQYESGRFLKPFQMLGIHSRAIVALD